MYKIEIEFVSKNNVQKNKVVGLLKRCFSIEKIYFIEKSRKVFMTLNFLPDTKQLEYMLNNNGYQISDIVVEKIVE